MQQNMLYIISYALIYIYVDFEIEQPEQCQWSVKPAWHEKYKSHDDKATELFLLHIHSI